MLTPEQIIAYTLKPGAVYKYSDKEVINTDVPHYFILINNDPLNEPLLLLTCVSSKVKQSKKRVLRRGQALNTLVELLEKDYEFLKEDSIIDCNFKVIKSKDQLIDKCRSGKFIVEKEIDKVKLAELQQAFLLSNKHEKALKRIIDPSY